MAHLYSVDGTHKEVTPANGKTFTVEELQELVGGYFEIVKSTQAYYLVDEDGISKGLAPNPFFELRRLLGPVLRCWKADNEID